MLHGCVLHRRRHCSSWHTGRARPRSSQPGFFCSALSAETTAKPAPMLPTAHYCAGLFPRFLKLCRRGLFLLCSGLLLGCRPCGGGHVVTRHAGVRVQMRWMLAVWRAQRGALQGPDRQLELFGLYSRFYLALMLGILFSWRLAECALLSPPPSPPPPSSYKETRSVYPLRASSISSIAHLSCLGGRRLSQP